MDRILWKLNGISKMNSYKEVRILFGTIFLVLLAQKQDIVMLARFGGMVGLIVLPCLPADGQITRGINGATRKN